MIPIGLVENQPLSSIAASPQSQQEPGLIKLVSPNRGSDLQDVVRVGQKVLGEAVFEHCVWLEQTGRDGAKTWGLGCASRPPISLAF